MKKFLILISLCLAGCASLDTNVTETADGDKTTRVKIRTFWDAKSELAKMHTTSTDKTQSVTVSGLAQESSGTNAVAAFEAFGRGLMKGAVEGAKPTP